MDENEVVVRRTKRAVKTIFFVLTMCVLAGISLLFSSKVPWLYKWFLFGLFLWLGLVSWISRIKPETNDTAGGEFLSHILRIILCVVNFYLLIGVVGGELAYVHLSYMYLAIPATLWFYVLYLIARANSKRNNTAYNDEQTAQNQQADANSVPQEIVRKWSMNLGLPGSATTQVDMGQFAKQLERSIEADNLKATAQYAGELREWWKLCTDEKKRASLEQAAFHYLHIDSRILGDDDVTNEEIAEQAIDWEVTSKPRIKQGWRPKWQ